MSVLKETFRRVVPTPLLEWSRRARLQARRRRVGRRPLSGPLADRVRCFGASGDDTFFGYYDLAPFDRAGRRLLACRRPVGEERAAGTSLELGWIDLDGGSRFHCFGATRAWCWQQGCRLQWWPDGSDASVLFNATREGHHVALRVGVDDGIELQHFGRAIYDLAPDGSLGLSLNFARLQRLRPGYGYDDLPDATVGQDAPVDDGVFRVHMADDRAELIIPLARLASLEPQASMAGAQHYVNHLRWSPGGQRFMGFHLWMDRDGRRNSRLFTAAADGSELFLVTNEQMVSHYWWLDPQRLLVYSGHAASGRHFHLYRDRAGLTGIFAATAMPEDGHPSLSPAGDRFLCDTYPDALSDRHLYLVDRAGEARRNLVSAFSPPALTGERRCDLHPRWSHDGRRVCFDSAHPGHRVLCVLDLDE